MSIVTIWSVFLNPVTYELEAKLKLSVNDNKDVIIQM